jgi:hypothetical protein
LLLIGKSVLFIARFIRFTSSFNGRTQQQTL